MARMSSQPTAAACPYGLRSGLVLRPHLSVGNITAAARLCGRHARLHRCTVLGQPRLRSRPPLSGFVGGDPAAGPSLGDNHQCHMMAAVIAGGGLPAAGVWLGGSDRRRDHRRCSALRAAARAAALAACRAASAASSRRSSAAPTRSLRRSSACAPEGLLNSTSSHS